jgi:predicted amidohydrolase YtcJ
VSERRRLLVIADRVHAPGSPATAASRAVLIEADRIVTIGSVDALRASYARARIIDLTGTTLTAGLCDAHIHLTEWALSRREVDLAAAESPEAAAEKVAACAAGGAGWIRGRGWNPHLWGGRDPLRQQLDNAAPGRPVALQSHDMHSLWASSRALQLAGISAATPDPEGGRIVRDGDGMPTGLLLENAARLVTDTLPAPSLEEMSDAVVAAQAELHRLGVTAVHSFPGIHVPLPDPLPVLESLRAADRLRLRVLQHIALPRLEDAARIGLRSGFGGDWIRIGGVKMFLDGALGSRTAWMRTPYQTLEHCGIRMMEPDTFRDVVRFAAEHGIATTVHAIGDAAVALALEVLTERQVRVAALPHRVEHVQCCPPDSFARPGAAGIVCSMQPCHLITDWRAADRHWGEDRAARTYAFSSLLRHGATLAFGSDAPVEPVDPRLGLFAAVGRRDLNGQPEAGWHSEEALTNEQALAGFTTGPAKAAGMAGHIGTLMSGAFADLVAWDRDPLTTPADGLLDLRCVATLVGGEVVFSN